MKKLFTAFVFMALFLLFLIYPQEVKNGALDGLYLWYNSVMPILLPFLILSGILIDTDSLSLLLFPLNFVQKRIKSIKPALFYPVILGLFCGFPMGAKVIADLIRSNTISVKQGNLLLPVVNQASPMFLAGFVGIHILKKKLAFLRILSFLYVPAFFVLFLRIIILLLFRSPGDSNAILLKTKKRTSLLQSTSFLRAQNKNSMSQIMEHTIWNSFHIVVVIGIYMMLFTIASRLCHRILPAPPALSLFLCTLEFSTGLNQLTEMHFLNPFFKTGFILALTSFGGFCTAAQTAAIVKDTGISMKSYLFWKFLIAAGVFFLYSSSASS